MLPHWDRSCRPNFPSHLVTVCWHRADQSQHWPYKHQAPGRVATGVPIFKSLVWSDPRKILAQAGFKPGIFCSRGGCLNHWANEAVCTDGWMTDKVTNGCPAGQTQQGHLLVTPSTTDPCMFTELPWSVPLINHLLHYLCQWSVRKMSHEWVKIIIIIIIIIIIMSVFLEHLSMWNMFNCPEQGQIQKYKTHASQNSRCPNKHAETSN